MEKIWTITISPDSAGQTVGAYLKQVLHLTQAQIRSLKFRKNGICICGQQVRVTYVLREGDLLQLQLEGGSHTCTRLVPVEYPLTVLYEDKDLIAVWKPAGVVTHPSHGHYQDSMANYLCAYFAKKGEDVQMRCIGRLDGDTSGILVFAKNKIAAAKLWKQRQCGVFQKEYLALCEGAFPETAYQRFQIASAPISPIPDEKNKMHVAADGKPACTFFQALRWNTDTRQTAARLFGESALTQSRTLVRLRLKTGRTHQIRVHMAYLGHPLADDPIYGNAISGYVSENIDVPQSCAISPEAGNGVPPAYTKLCAWKVWLLQPFTEEKISFTVMN